MKLSMFLPFEPDRRGKLAQQCGVTHAIVKLAPELTGRNPPWDIDVLVEAKRRFSDAGFELAGLEGDQMDMTQIKLGRPGRDEDIELYCKMLRNMGELEIPLLCYNFMVGIGWFRTRTDIVERGGAFTSRFDQSDLTREQADCDQIISADEVWSNYRFFVEQQ